MASQSTGEPGGEGSPYLDTAMHQVCSYMASPGKVGPEVGHQLSHKEVLVVAVVVVMVVVMVVVVVVMVVVVVVVVVVMVMMVVVVVL